VLPYGAFARNPIAPIAPRLEISLGPFRQKHAPRCAESRMRSLEVFGRARRAFARVRSRIKSSAPEPWARVNRVPERMPIVPTCTSP
jgi:hypothetical protein